MRLLIISDLHIGEKARTKELCPYPSGDHKDDQLVNSFLKIAKEDQAKKGKYDYLIIPGDITNKSNLIEYDCGTKFLDKLSKELEIEITNIIFVPGNHDVDWSVLEGVPELEKSYRTRHKYNTLKDSNHIFSKLMGPMLAEDPYIKKWEFPNVVFFGFNSSWHDDSIHDTHYGLIQTAQINALRDSLVKTDLNKLKIFVVHHHLHQFVNPLPKWIDVSIMQNAQPLINLLSEFSFNFVIHGHRHTPHFTTTKIENFNPINILCSGSYSCEVPTEIAGFVGNIFHIIETDEYTPYKCKGRVISMAYDSRNGWINSKEQYGIDYINPFGNEIGLDILTKNCSEELTKELSSSEISYFSKLQENNPELKYLPLHSRGKLIQDLAITCNVTTATTSDDLIFIKNKK